MVLLVSTQGRRVGKWDLTTSTKAYLCMELKAFFMSREASQKWGLVRRRAETVIGVGEDLGAVRARYGLTWLKNQLQLPPLLSLEKKVLEKKTAATTRKSGS